MAREWIKFREELFNHPKFLSLTSLMMYSDERFGLLVYSCGEDALEIGVMPPSNESVTRRALRCVTLDALHDVTMCCLLRVWCAVNSHCKVCGDDAVMSPMMLDDLDRIAKCDGFGEALADVGWVTQSDDNTLLFKNFLEFNDPSCLRLKPKTNAERQAEYRARKAAESQKSDSVTKVTKSNAREEKRREEKKKKKENPLPPLPENLQTEQFRQAWECWTRHRVEIKKPLKPTQLHAILAKLSGWGHDRAIAAIEHTIAMGWQGLREPDQNSNGRSAAETIQEQNERAIEEGIRIAAERKRQRELAK